MTFVFQVFGDKVLEIFILFQFLGNPFNRDISVKSGQRWLTE